LDEAEDADNKTTQENGRVASSSPWLAGDLSELRDDGVDLEMDKSLAVTASWRARVWGCAVEAARA
jgi:hypothetical protein